MYDDHTITAILKTYVVADILSNHLNKPVVFQFRCEICGIKFRDRNEMIIHTDTTHYYIDTSRQKYVCVRCHKGYRRKLSIIQHTMLHITYI